MSGAWIKGERCGVANCPSQFWRLNDGQYICQHGHIRQGNEYGLDDDEFFATSQLRVQQKRPKRGVAAQGQVKRKLKGRPVKELCWYAMQQMLEAEVRFMIAVVGCPSEFSNVAQDIFHRYTCHTWDNPEITTKSYMTDNSYVDLLCLLACLYITCRHLQLPICMFEILMWVENFSLPYMQPQDFIEPEIMKYMPRSVLNFFAQDSPPTVGQLENSVHIVRECINAFDDTYSEKPILIEPLIYKFTRMMLMPPQVAVTAIRLARHIEFEGRSGVVDMGNFWGPEHHTLGLVVVSAKLLYGLDGIHREFEPTSPAADHPHWHVWCDVFRKLMLQNDYLSTIEDRAAMVMTREEKHQWLDFYQEHLLELPWEHAHRYTRIRRVHPLKYFRTGELNPDFVTSETLEELNALVTETVGEDLSDLTMPEVAVPPPSRSGTGAYARGPGSLYQSYVANNRAEWADVPLIIDLIETVLRRYTSKTILTARQVVRRVELALRKKNLAIYKYMEREGTIVNIHSFRLNYDNAMLQLINGMRPPRAVPVGFTKYPPVTKLSAEKLDQLSKSLKPKDAVRPSLTEEQKLWGLAEHPTRPHFLHPVKVDRKLRPRLPADRERERQRERKAKKPRLAFKPAIGFEQFLRKNFPADIELIKRARNERLVQMGLPIDNITVQDKDAADTMTPQACDVVDLSESETGQNDMNLRNHGNSSPEISAGVNGLATNAVDSGKH